MNPFDVLKVKKAWESFSSSHPKTVAFINYLSTSPIEVGDIVSFAVEKGSNGKKISTNFKVTEEDMELVKLIQSLGNK